MTVRALPFYKLLFVFGNMTCLAQLVLLLEYQVLMALFTSQLLMRTGQREFGLIVFESGFLP